MTTAQEALRAGLAALIEAAMRDRFSSLTSTWPKTVAPDIAAYLTSHRAEVLAALGMEQVGHIAEKEDDGEGCWSFFYGDEGDGVMVRNERPVFAPKETTTLDTPEQTEEGKP